MAQSLHQSTQKNEILSRKEPPTTRGQLQVSESPSTSTITNNPQFLLVQLSQFQAMRNTNSEHCNLKEEKRGKKPSNIK
jgi:hypothetical protein